MKGLVPMVAGLLLIGSGCGLDQPKHTAADEEPRHPSNEMKTLPKEEPKHMEPSKLVAAKRAPGKLPRVPAFEDPRKIPSGIEYSEMVRRFGPPTMRINDGPSQTTYSYSKLKTQVQVEVRNGKVVAVAAIDTGY